LDLLDVSGYAVLFSEFHAKPALAESVAAAWDEYLNPKSSATRPAQIIAAAIHLGNPLGFLPHRGTVRTSWRMAVTRAMRAVPQRPAVGRAFPLGEEVPVHDSDLVRLFASDRYGIRYMGIDVAIYRLLKKGIDSSVDFGRAGFDIGRAIEYQKRRLN
jgi:hypothetical protein